MACIVLKIKKYLGHSKNSINGNNCYDKKEKINQSISRTTRLIPSEMCHIVEKAITLLWSA